MTICPHCGVSLAQPASVCPNCGLRLRQEAPGGVPPTDRPRFAASPVSVGRYLLWWTVALFSNAELVCCVLTFVFAFSSSDRNRANFFRAVLVFKLFAVLLGMIAVLILVLMGFSFTDLLNSFDFGAAWQLLREVF